MFKIKPVETYSPHIGVLVSMMTACRYKTLRVVRHLTTEQLDYLWDENANSIGALLLHRCALEVAYQELSFFGRDLLDNPQLREKWLIPFTLGEEARSNLKGHEIEFYLSQLEETRSKTLGLLSEQNDDWLWLEGKQCWSDHITNNYWRWYHVVEDEINHRGQIVWLKSRIPSSLESN
ncbi:MAG: DUF664 domain-containing protein [Deinococcota bacterium]